MFVYDVYTYEERGKKKVQKKTFLRFFSPPLPSSFKKM